MAARVFEHQHRVTYGDCTVGNHVYHANYFTILEAARGEFVRSLGATLLVLQGQDVIFPVVECSMRYKLPARYDDLLTIAIRVTELKGARVSFGHTITNQDGKLIIEAQTRHACTTLADKPRRIPRAIVEKLSAFFSDHPSAL